MGTAVGSRSEWALSAKPKRPHKEKQAPQQPAPGGDAAAIPPPPPTVAPPEELPRARKPLLRSSYRKKPKTDEERKAERAMAVEAARLNGGTTHLAGGKQMRERLLEGGQGSRRAEPLLLLDAYNYMNKDPACKGFMGPGLLSLSKARAVLQQQLTAYAERERAEILIFYDAMGSRRQATQEEWLSQRVLAVYAVECEADTLIIDELAELRQKYSSSPSSQRPVRVISDDRRIIEEVGPASFDTRFDIVAWPVDIFRSKLADSEQRASEQAKAANSTQRMRPVSPHVDTARWAEQVVRGTAAGRMLPVPLQPQPQVAGGGTAGGSVAGGGAAAGSGGQLAGADAVLHGFDELMELSGGMHASGDGGLGEEAAGPQRSGSLPGEQCAAAPGASADAPQAPSASSLLDGLLHNLNYSDLELDELLKE